MASMMKIVLQVFLVALMREAIDAREEHEGYTGKITKYSPIPAVNSKSPVIVNQASVGTPQNLARNVFPGNKMELYNLQNGPVFRETYYMHKIEVKIPKDRAIRVKFTREAMLDRSGRICLNFSKSYNLRHDLNQNVKYVSSSVRYEKFNNGKKELIPGENGTISINENALEESVELSAKVGYDDAITSQCSQAVWTMNGTVVRMYTTNPDFREGVNEISTIVFYTALGVFVLISIGLGIYLFCIRSEEEE
ncbi:uncharacterized protein LOC116308550 [Actinia tenebrosa]|uniref:Uncharacterized protein LOC116308550 n=1 Tax=Actinia tenebrosa TaxID=6105 RepID=A0A6P8JAW4_ACTTE|nr:uncharacterized protein LOC116308550 [Actinia tenebrosa]